MVSLAAPSILCRFVLTLVDLQLEVQHINLFENDDRHRVCGPHSSDRAIVHRCP